MSTRPTGKIAVNRKALHDYFVQDRIEAGIALQGTEVKSVRAGNVNLTSSYVQIDGRDAFLRDAHIAEYEQGNRHNHAPDRARRLLLHRDELLRLHQQVGQKGMTLIPLSFYFKKGLIKVELGICKGKAGHDKRETLKRKMADREAQRAMRGNR